MTLSKLFRRLNCTIPFLYKKRGGQYFSIGSCIADNLRAIDKEMFNPLCQDQFNQHPCLQMMADPFVVYDGGYYYIFYEELTLKWMARGADIAVLKSSDAKKWERIGIAIREPFHLSFPNVFTYNGDWYMIPEANESKALTIYRATKFPMHWERYINIFENTPYADPMIYSQDGYFYLWINTYVNGNDLRLFTSRELQGPWDEHPMSPIRRNNDETRPGSTIISYDGNLYYFIQDNSEGYGTGLIAYEIDVLTPSMYKDHRLEAPPFLWKHGDKWASDGMHQFSMCKMNEKYLCVVDGCKNESSGGWKWSWLNWPIHY